MAMWAIWIIIGLVAILIEIFTAGFAVVCFTIGAFVAAIAAACGLSFGIQLLLFSVATVVAIVAVRPLMVRLFIKGRGLPTNVEALVGRVAVVTSTIEGGEGRVSIDGDDWRAQVADGDVTIEVGARVEVVSVESVILIVKRV